MIRSFERLQNAGGQMANLCYNLSQKGQMPIQEDWATTMRVLAKDWDAALTDAKRDIAELEERAASVPPVFDPIELGC